MEKISKLPVMEDVSEVPYETGDYSPARDVNNILKPRKFAPILGEIGNTTSIYDKETTLEKPLNLEDGEKKQTNSNIILIIVIAVIIFKIL